MGVAINADVTATFIGRKRGMFTHDGCEYSGQIVFDTLNVPFTYHKELEPIDCYLLDEYRWSYLCKDILPVRERSAHKGNFGHVLVIGGDKGFGAPQAGAATERREEVARGCLG